MNIQESSKKEQFAISMERTAKKTGRMPNLESAAAGNGFGSDPSGLSKDPRRQQAGAHSMLMAEHRLYKMLQPQNAAVRSPAGF